MSKAVPNFSIRGIRQTLMSGVILGRVSAGSGQAEAIPLSQITEQVAGGLAPVATSGSYNDLSNKPTIPTNSSFTLAGLGDVSVAEGSSVDQNALIWNNATSKWIASPQWKLSGTILYYAAGQVGIGTSSPVASGLTINSNANGPPSPAIPGSTQLHLVGADGQLSIIEWDTFGTNGDMFFRRADGTKAAPLALGANETLGAVIAGGYNGSAYSLNKVTIQFNTNGAWSTSSEGTAITFLCTPQGSVGANLPTMVVGGTGFGTGVGVGINLGANVMPLEALEVNGAVRLDSATPNSTTNALYANGTTLMWNGAAVGGGGGGAGGLYANQLGTLPSSANTGLTTWMNQGTATVTDTNAGVLLDCPGATGVNIHARSKAAPATPYSITALVSMVGNFTSFSQTGIGFSDGTKLHTIGLLWNQTNFTFTLEVDKWTSATAFSASDLTTVSSLRVAGGFLWLQIRDDGTTVYFKVSTDGVNFLTLFSIAKASGFLGSTGYSHVVFFANQQSSNEMLATLMSWTQGS